MKIVKKLFNRNLVVDMRYVQKFSIVNWFLTVFSFQKKNAEIFFAQTKYMASLRQ